MGLPTVVQGALRPSLSITWYRGNTTTPEDLTGATLTGTLQRVGVSATQAVAGALVLVNAAGGAFRWDLDAADVATPGDYWVEFTAAFASGASPAKTFAERWTVARSLAGG